MTTEETLDEVLDNYANVMASTPPEAHDAVLDLLLLASMADGQVQDIEMDELVKQYSRFPFYRQEHAEHLCGIDGFFHRGELMERYRTQESMDDFLVKLGEQLGSDEAKLEALHVVSAILWSDSMQEAEIDFFFSVGAGFGLPRAEVDQALRGSMPGNRAEAPA